MLARDTHLQQRTKGLRPESESPVFLVTPTMRSWNQFSAFIKEWGGTSDGTMMSFDGGSPYTAAHTTRG